MPRRTDFIGKIIDPVPRFWGALCILPGFLLLENFILRGLLTFLFVILALAAGKKIYWMYFLILMFTILFFHVLNPIGRVLYTIGPIVITEQALISGMNRATGLIGMVMISVAAIRPELKLPGKLGGLLGKTFYYFDQIIEGKNKITLKNFFGSLDNWLLQRLNPELNDKIHTAKRKYSYRGWIFAFLLVIMVWLVWVLDRFYLNKLLDSN